ncbi:hypothetical protein HB162lentus_03380 [Mammaliicoccus lentus]
MFLDNGLGAFIYIFGIESICLCRCFLCTYYFRETTIILSHDFLNNWFNKYKCSIIVVLINLGDKNEKATSDIY